MNRKIVYILLCMFIFSCNKIDKPKKPDNLISKNVMIDIITDISLVNAAKTVDKKILEKNGIIPENYIYQKYDIDSIQFTESNNYYAYNVKAYEDIYLQVKQRLGQQKAKNKEQGDKERKEKDSIRLAKKKAKDSLKGEKLQKKLLQEIKPSNLLKKERKSLE